MEEPIYMIPIKNREFTPAVAPPEPVPNKLVFVFLQTVPTIVNRW